MTTVIPQGGWLGLLDVGIGTSATAGARVGAASTARAAVTARTGLHGASDAHEVGALRQGAGGDGAVGVAGGGLAEVDGHAGVVHAHLIGGVEYGVCNDFGDFCTSRFLLIPNALLYHHVLVECFRRNGVP